MFTRLNLCRRSFVRRHGSNIVLVGFCSSGKTTLAPLLAHALGLAYLDLDAELARRVGVDVIELIETRGVREFRRLESRLLRELAHEQFVVSTGSGTPASFLRLLLIQRIGTSVWLRAPFDVILERMSRVAARGVPHWPSIPEGSLPDQLHLRESWERRQRFYRQADITVDATPGPSQVCSDLLRQLESVRPELLSNDRTSTVVPHKSEQITHLN